MRRAPFAFVLAVLAVVMTTAAAGSARAAGEDEWQLALRLGGGNSNGYPLQPWGFAGALDLEYGFHEAFSARASVGLVSYPVDAVKNGPPAGTLQARTALLGLSYTVDVLRLMPYIEVSVGLLGWSGPGAPATGFGAELGLGADYLITPHWGLGGSAQYIFAPADLFANAMQFGQRPLAFSLTMRLSRIF